MQFIVATVASLAALVAAAPADNGCTPGTYQCSYNPNGPQNSTGWDVCDVNKAWVNAGSCPPTQHCWFDTQNGSPYCK